MSLQVAFVTTDCSDPVRLGNWWAERFSGQILEEHGGEFVLVQIPGSVLGFQKVPDPTPGKNRMHFDLSTDQDLDTVVAGLVEAGASKVAEREEHGFRWFTLADPEGNLFCVAPGS